MCPIFASQPDVVAAKTGSSSGRTIRTVDYLRCKCLATCEIRVLDEATRTFTDETNREWLAERVGRTSGIVGPDGKSALPGPADILRFSCSTDPSQKLREATVTAGSLSELSEAQLREILGSARILFQA